jgi:Zn-dependent protease/CBS domain-containing protein
MPRQLFGALDRRLVRENAQMLGNSIALFRVGGTDVRLHPTFFLLLAWIAALGWMRRGAAAAIDAVVFMASLFLCVLLHEFGHVFAARRYGIATRDVTLLPIGGVASLDRMPEKPSQDIVVALAGPAVNVVIAVLLLALHHLQGGTMASSQFAELERPHAGLLLQLAAANIALVVFNLVPAFPMDGGRVLRALIASQTGYVRATRIAAGIGQVIAVLLGFLGLFGNPLLILVAIFVFLAASAEAGFVQGRDLTRGRRVSDAMITTFASLGPQSSVGAAADLLLRTTQHEFPVLDGARRLRGVITREAILAALQAHGDAKGIMELALPDIATVHEHASLEAVFERMQREGTRFVGILDGSGAFVGYLTPENIAELVMIGAARAARPATAAP